MQVREGWATEFGREKFDVTVEQADLPLILREVGIPVEMADRLTVTEQFALMKLTAQWYAAAEQRRVVEDRIAADSRAAVLVSQRTAYAATVRTRLGLDQPAAPQAQHAAA